MSNGGAQLISFGPFPQNAGNVYSSIKVYHYSAGTTTLKNVWSDESKTTTAEQPVASNSIGICSFYADGDYRFVITDSDDNTITTHDNYRVTSDTGTMWEGNAGTAFPSASPANRWQMFAKHTAGNTLEDIGINQGDGFIGIGGSSLPSYTKANLPTPGIAGRRARVTDDVRGIWMDTGSQWIGINGEIVNVKEFGAKGDASTDDTAAIQSAINALSSGGTLYFPRGIYLISDQINIIGFNGIRVMGAGNSGTQIQWNASADATKAMILWKWTAYSELSNITLFGSNTTRPGFGLWVTSNGTGGTNITGFNNFHDLRINGTLVAGIQVGSLTNIDVNVDGNTFSKVEITFSGVAGIRIWNSNTNNTVFRDSAISNSLTSGVDLGLSSRGNFFENIQMANNGSQHFLVRKEQGSVITIKNFVIELDAGLHPFLVAEVTSGGVSGNSILEMSNLNLTYGASGTHRIIDYQQSGQVSIKNSRFAGPAVGPPLTGNIAELYFAPPGAPNPGMNTLYTENVHLYQGAHFNVVTTTGTPTARWVNLGYSYSDSPSSATTSPDISLFNVKLYDEYSIKVNKTGVSYTNIGLMGRYTRKVRISEEAWTDAATTSTIAVLTLPTKSRIVSVITELIVPFAGLSGTITLSVGLAGDGDVDKFILANDVKTIFGIGTRGLADESMGVGLARATAIQGGYMRTFGVDQISVTLNSGSGNIGNGAATHLNSGTIDIYITVEQLE